MTDYEEIGFTDQLFNYRKDLAKFPLANEMNALLEKYRSQLTIDGVRKIKIFIQTCASPDFVLTNFTPKDIEIQRLQLENAWLILKMSIPKIDSNNQVFSLLEHLVFSSIDARLLRARDGFERHTQNETRRSETITNLSPPMNKKFYEKER